MSAVDNIKIYLSGGAGNSNPNASLGGAISATRLLSQSVTGISNITGVTAIEARGGGVGSGTLAYTAAGNLLVYTPPGGSAGAAVAISADGTYFLKGADGIATLEITAVALSLPGTNQSDTLTVARIANNLWDNISGSEGRGGDTEYRCIYYKNTSGLAYQFRAWIYAQPTGNSTLQVGLDAAGVNGVAVTIANENTAPVGVTFSAPSTEAGALQAILPAGASIACWERRAIVGGEYPAVPSAFYTISYSVVED
jgi:hypothetical protein